MRSTSAKIISRVVLVVCTAFCTLAAGSVARASDLIITGVFDGPFISRPRGIELYAKADIADLSIYGIERTANGADIAGQQYSFPAKSVPAGTYLYLTNGADDFLSFFGLLADFEESSVASFNGDDGVVLYRGGLVVDIFGETGVDGTGQPWEYRDGWAYRVSDTGPDGNAFNVSSWTFSGIDVFDGRSSNSEAVPPFPARTYASSDVSPQSPLEYLVFNEVLPDPSGANVSFDTDGDGIFEDDDEFIELYNTSSVSLDISGLEFWDRGIGLTFTVPQNTILGPNSFLVVIGSTFEGTPPVVDPGSFAFVADSGSLSLNNAADNLVVYDPTVDEYIQGLFNGDAADDPPNDYTGFSTSATRVGNVQDLGFDLDGTSIALSPDGDVSKPVIHSSVEDGVNLAASPGAANPVPLIITRIHQIQGDGETSPMVGDEVAIEGIVVGDFQAGIGIHGELGGFFVQEEDVDIDANPATSEGIFVSDPGGQLAVIAPGDRVRVVGTVSEFFGQTELRSITEVTILSTGNSLPTPATVSLPGSLEAFEGMLVRFPDTLTVTEMFNLDRFGEVRLYAGDRPFQWTEKNLPDVQGYADHLAAIEARTITLDDGRTIQNPDPIVYPDGEIDGDDAFRMGDTVTDLQGVLAYTFEEFRVHPTGVPPVFTEGNARPNGPPSVGGNLKLASLNVQNFFVSIDGTDFCGPSLGAGCRGADSSQEYDRQLMKLVAGLAELDADIVGLVELENTTGVAVLQTLVNALNAKLGAGTYSFIDSGVYGEDVIRQGIIYKPAAVLAVGSPAILDDSFDANYQQSRNRPTLLQSFQELTGGERFSVGVVHLKSKGSACDDLGDVDQNDGQGRCNLTRRNAAEVILDWLVTDPTSAGVADVVLLGDFNSYALEDPISAIKAGGFTPVSADYSYVFDGQKGNLNYILTSPGLTSRVTGGGAWHINADEADAIDYNLDFGRPANIYRPDVFRSADHDPIVAGLVFSPPPPGQPAIPVVERIDFDGNTLLVTVSIGDTGNAPIERYDVSCSDGTDTLSGSGPGPTIAVPDAVFDITYQCTATATNTGGFTSGSSQPSVPITPEELSSGLPVWLLFVGDQNRP